jgi:hypothetical protein
MPNKRYTARGARGPRDSRGPRNPGGWRRGRSPRRTPWARGAPALALGGLLLLTGAGAAWGWTPRTQQTIAWEAAQLAPPDLSRQLIKRRASYLTGVLLPFDDADAGRHRKNPDGGGSLDQALAEAVTQAVAAIRSHRPFDEIVLRMGVAAHFMADANNPLATSAADPEAGRYFVDFLRYAETAEPRFPLVFYGIRPGLEREGGVSALLSEALRRGRALYPMVGMEYRRIEFASGIGVFDDRSTAFGVASISFSHAVTDVSAVLRYIWLRAGGGDERSNLPAGGTHLVLLPRAGLPPRLSAAAARP